MQIKRITFASFHGNTYFLTDMLNLAEGNISFKIHFNFYLQNLIIFFSDYQNMQRKTLYLTKNVLFWKHKIVWKVLLPSLMPVARVAAKTRYDAMLQ